jgi:iron only hydrogenase large subunit-like protein
MFSGVVKIADIDDYITPSQNCIKPLLDQEKIDQKKSQKIQLENFQEHTISEPDLIKIKDKNKKSAAVSLNDCLACNGCVTTAETLLIQAQSVDEFLRNSLNCAMSNKLSVVCISPQSVLSIAEFYSFTAEETLKKITTVFKKAGVDYLLNFNTATLLTLLECYQEFKDKILNENNKYLISSECPGWVCYAEKKIGDWVIPYLSNIKSPQQVLAHIVKKMLMDKFKKEVYLTCIMPCFDKKLEATRPSYKIESYLEVDTVISTIEILELFEKLNIDFEKDELNNQSIYIPFISLLNNQVIKPEENYQVFFSSHENFTSNCYSEFILSEYIKEYMSERNYKIERKFGKNSDFKEIFLYEDGKESPILSFCLVYGFRNIQNIVRNKNKIKYHYLEVMACPGGCINGGGQIRPKEQNVTPRDLFRKIEQKYKDSHLKILDSSLKSDIEYDLKCTFDYFKEHSYQIFKQIFYTEFKALDKNNTLNLKW